MSVGNLAIGWHNLMDDGSNSVDSTSAVLPADNLLSEDVQEIWRSSTATGTALFVTLSAQFVVRAVVLANTNLSSGDLVQVRFSTSDPNGLTGLVYDSGSMPSAVDSTTRLFAHIFPSNFTGRYLRIDLAHSSPPEAGRLYVGPIWFPSHNWQYGWNAQWRDYSRRTASIGLRLFIDQQKRQRGFRGTLIGLSGDEADDEVREMNRRAGTHAGVFLSWDYLNNPSRRGIWGLLEQPVPVPQLFFEGWSADIEIWESI
jgi:hypothetical protein